MPLEIVHVHIGASPGGLGLAVAATSSLPRVQVHLVGRPGEDEDPYFQRTIYARDGSYRHDRHVPVASFTCPEGACVPRELRAALASAELVLITVTLREHIDHRIALIEALPSHCPSDCEIVFIACENTLTPAHRSLIATLEPRVLSVDAIVDRVCTWPDLSDVAPTPRHVVYHEIGEWILRAPQESSRLIQVLSEAEEVEVVDESHFRAYLDRKSWFVNGMHLDTSIRGRAHNQPDLRRIAADPVLFAPVQETLAVMRDAYAYRHGLIVPSTWMGERLQVLCQLPDSADRVLRTLHRANPAPFLEGVERRIAVPARVRNAGGQSLPPSMRQLAEDLTLVLCDLEQYPDWHELRAGDLSEDRDEQAVETFERALSGWVEQDFIVRSARRLRRELARHRRVLA